MLSTVLLLASTPPEQRDVALGGTVYAIGYGGLLTGLVGGRLALGTYRAALRTRGVVKRRVNELKEDVDEWVDDVEKTIKDAADEAADAIIPDFLKGR